MSNGQTVEQKLEWLLKTYDVADEADLRQRYREQYGEAVHHATARKAIRRFDAGRRPPREDVVETGVAASAAPAAPLNAEALRALTAVIHEVNEFDGPRTCRRFVDLVRRAGGLEAFEAVLDLMGEL